MQLFKILLKSFKFWLVKFSYRSSMSPLRDKGFFSERENVEWSADPL